MIDLRSDTITIPTPEMREVMKEAFVGDDVFGDDSTINNLEKRVAEILGKEASVYMPSGTMTNQVAIRTHTEPGDEVLLEQSAHVYFNEAGATAALSGVICRLIPGDRGVYGAEDIKAAIRPVNDHYPRTKLVCVENTSNRGGGKVWPLEKLAEVKKTASENGLKTHLDGARIWNAAAAMNIPESEIAKHFDSLSVCFSKGLGAPVGSALAGSNDFIMEARRFRKQFGGGMRQAGIIAAGALYALENNRERLTVDHDNAKMLAKGLSEINGIDINPDEVETNIINFRVKGLNIHALIEKLKKQGTLVLAKDSITIRAVTNLMVSESQINIALDHVRNAMKK